MDSIFPKWRALPLRAGMKVGAPLIARDLRRAVLDKLDQLGPAVAVMYKCAQVDHLLLKEIRFRGTRTVNVYPDCSPLAQGKTLRSALGHYDLVVSTKHWHPKAWHATFGYTNRCEFVPHGYDPALHYSAIDEGLTQPIDVLLIATYRAEYANLMIALSRLPGMGELHFEVHGDGWEKIRNLTPKNWRIGRGVHGHSYRRLVSLAKICIAPVTREVVVDGISYPGDDDTTRTYELPAMGAFVIHRRTAYVASLFEERLEMLMYGDAIELAEHIHWAIRNPDSRRSIRVAAQRRCIQRDSLDQRAKALVQLLTSVA